MARKIAKEHKDKEKLWGDWLAPRQKMGEIRDRKRSSREKSTIIVKPKKRGKDFISRKKKTPLEEYREGRSKMPVKTPKGRLKTPKGKSLIKKQFKTSISKNFT